jgi:hypothetical protein
MKKIFCTIVFLCLVVLTFTSVVYAQRGEGDPRGPKGREKVDQLRKMKLIETLGLDEEKSVRFISRFSKHQEHIRALYLERGTIVDNLEEAIKETRESEYSKLIDGMFSIEQKIIDARIDFIKNLNDLLSKKQQAKFLVFERNFNRDLRDMIFDAKRGQGRER